jgi:hypothetical protein
MTQQHQSQISSTEIDDNYRRLPTGRENKKGGGRRNRKDGKKGKDRGTKKKRMTMIGFQRAERKKGTRRHP